MLMSILLLSNFESEAFCKKKRKKKAKTTQVAPADTTRAVRAPGVKNQRELDSIKNSRVKKPQ
jgi:hypothetical protein